jgi:C-terminal processing protease CtpA/Prc
VSATSENDHVTYKQVRELVDRIVKEVQDTANRTYEDIRREVASVNVRLSTYVDEKRAQELTKETADKLAETTGNVATREYQVKVESRLSKLEANQYVQIGLLFASIVASGVGLYRLFAGH